MEKKMKLSKPISLIAIIACSISAAANGNTLDCKILYTQLSVAKTDQMEMAKRYVACVANVPQLSDSSVFLGFTCEFELNQAIRGQRELSAHYGQATSLCPSKIDASKLGAIRRDIRPAQLLPTTWSKMALVDSSAVNPLVNKKMQR
jgi:hypothetical protein